MRNLLNTIILNTYFGISKVSTAITKNGYIQDSYFGLVFMLLLK